MEWTDESIRLLTVYWADGLSTAEIGRRLGVSKNAVVGKAHRLELTARPSPIHWDGPPRQRTKPRPSPAPRITGATLPPLESAGPAADRPASGTTQAPIAARLPVEINGARGATALPAAAPPAAGSRQVPPAPAQIAEVADRALPAQAKRDGEPAAAPPRALKPVQEAPPPRTTAASTRAALQAVASRPFGRVVTCCWPIGEPGTRDFHFCDGRSVPGKPYCEEHAALAYVKVRDRREDAA